MTPILLFLSKLSVAALLLAVGMLSSMKEAAYLRRRPPLLLRSVAAMYILVPLAATIFVTVLPLGPGLKMAISAGAPLLPKKLMGLGSDECVFSLVVTASILAIVTVPAWAGVCGNRTEQAKDCLEQGDLEEALNAASAIGGDRLQRQATGMVRPDGFTHGTSVQRQRWFHNGSESGRLEARDTFQARIL